MTNQRQTVVVTGVAGNLGRRLLPQLDGFNVVGLDIRPPESTELARFEQIDLGTETACSQLIDLLRETEAVAVVHLAFVLDPLQTGVLDEERMWQINVAGTARVMEAISVVNRHRGDVRQFIFPSSVAAYGPDTPPLVNEDHPLEAHTLPYAMHKKLSDEVVRYRQDWMSDCRTYMLRPHIYAGATVQNYMVGALRGTPTGQGKRAVRMRERGKRLPLLLPWGKQYLEQRLQFVHVDDVARLIVHILRRDVANDPQISILNVAGRGEALTLAQCAQLANAKIVRVPNRKIYGMILRKLWDWGVSGIPPDALPYMIGTYTMDTTRLQRFLGADYRSVIQHTVEEALRDCFAESATAAVV